MFAKVRLWIGKFAISSKKSQPKVWWFAAGDNVVVHRNHVTAMGIEAMVIVVPPPLLPPPLVVNRDRVRIPSL